MGTDVSCTSREVSLCNHTIKQRNILIVPDTTLDERFVNNPMVNWDPHVKFYAEIELRTKDGLSVGSLCVIDFEAKSLNTHQQNALMVLSRQIINLMELHWSLQSLAIENKKTEQQKLHIEASEVKLNSIFNSSEDIHILIGKDLKVLAFNKSAFDLININYKSYISEGDCILDYTDIRMEKHFSKNFLLALRGRCTKRIWMLLPGTVNCLPERNFIFMC